MKGIAMNVLEVALMFGCGYACRDAIAKHKLKVLEKEVRQLKQQIKKGN